MKKTIYYIVIVMLVLAVLLLPISASESMTESVTEIETESASEIVTELTSEGASEALTEAISIDEDAASEIIGIIEDSGSKTQAILEIAEKLGITYEEAEDVLDTFLEVGDKYLGENKIWIGFKRDVQENLQFWVIVVVCALSVLTIIVMIFIQVAKTNPMMRKSMFGMDKALGYTEKTSNAILQTLGEIKSLHAEATEKEAVYQKIIAEKEDNILKLEEKIKRLEEESKKEKRNMVLTESYIFQILKLICARTNLPISDRAAIDLWKAKGIELLKEELSADDIAKLDSIAAIIEKGDADEDK